MRNVTLADYYTPEGAWGFGGVGGAQIYQFLMSDPEVRKAMEANATLPKTTGVSALGVEDLTPILADAEVQEQQLYLWKEIPKLPAHDLVIQTPRLDRTNTNRGMTGFVSSNSSGNVSDAQFTRTTQEVKFMAVKGQVTLPTQLVRQVTFTGVRDAAAMQLAETLAMRTLLKLAERNLPYADSTVSDSEFNGILQQIGAAATADNRIRMDLRGAPPDQDFLEQLCEIGLHNSGNPTHFHVPNKVRRDLLQAMFPKTRAEEGYAAGLVGFNFDRYMAQTLGGDQTTVQIRRNQMMSLGVPDGLPWTPGSSASPNGPDAPSSVTGAGAAHTATDYAPGLAAGTYYYSVEAASEGGASLPTASAGIVPTAAQKVTLSITCTDSTADFFYVFRNPEGVSGVAAANRKFMARVARSGNVTTWDDTGFYLPGTSNSMFLSQRETELRFRQLLPPLKRPLPRGLMDDTFGILLFGAVEIPVPTHHVWVANIGERDQTGVASLVS